MKTAIEKPMTPGGVFDHLMEPQGDEPEFLLQGPEDDDHAGVPRGDGQVSVLE